MIKLLSNKIYKTDFSEINDHRIYRVLYQALDDGKSIFTFIFHFNVGFSRNVKRHPLMYLRGKTYLDPRNIIFFFFLSLIN